MRTFWSILLSIFVVSNLFGIDTLTILDKIGVNQKDLTADGDSVVDYSGVPILIRTKHGEVKHIGRKLFAEDFRRFNDAKVLDYVEAAYLNYILKSGDKKYDGLNFDKGSWKSLESVNDSTACSITIINDKEYCVEWGDEKGCFVKILFPVEYDKLQRATNRTELEDDFINGLKRYEPIGRIEKDFKVEDMKAVNDSVFILPGRTYTIADVRSDLYYKADEEGQMSLLFEETYLAESLANLFVAGFTGEQSVTLDMKILRHEYGKTQLESIDIKQLIEYCELQGCQPYWGVETIDDKCLKGTMFMYNQHEGYDHIFRVECPIGEINNAQMRIKARVSLFVPTSNVNNLFEQYDEEKGKKPRFKVE